GAPFASRWVMVDSACAGATATQNETLSTPAVDASACSTVQLRFSNQFDWFSGSLDEIADVDVSTNGGGAWTNVLRMQGASDGYPLPGTKTLDISALAAGQPSVKVRFHDYNGGNEQWWAVDNVEILCRTTVCNSCAPAPPGEPGVSSPLRLERSGGTLALSWGAVSAGCGGTDYAVYQGSLPSLHAGSFDHAPVVCTTGG